MKKILRFIVLCHLLSAAAFCARGQGAAFTYQGRLNDGTNPANGLYDFIFLVYPDTNTAVPLVSGYPVLALPVSNGLFLATVDFGTGVFTGADRWLGISVRSNGAPGYVALNSRQKFAPTPYAVLAETVASGGLSAGAYGSALILNNPANQITGSFGGNGSGVTNVNAASLGGLGTNGFWQTGGNAGTSPGVNFLGTSDNKPLELRVNNQRGLRLEPTTPTDAPNVIGGYSANTIFPGVVGGTIGGGGSAGAINSILPGANYATVAGGVLNSAGGSQATVGGGNVNSAGGFLATVAGGRGNSATGAASTVSGGERNVVQTNSDDATIGGGVANLVQTGAQMSGIASGSSNVVVGPFAFIGGGANNSAGQYATVSGGLYNQAAANSVVSGGSSNLSAGGYNTIGGGVGNIHDIFTGYSTIGGGQGNVVSWRAGYPEGFYATVGGGLGNVAVGGWSTIAGGSSNGAYGSFSFVAGGSSNFAGGAYSFAAGNRAKAGYNGSYVWADAQPADFVSTSTNQYLIRAGGGVGIGVTNPEAPLQIAPNAGGGGIVVGMDAFGGGFTALQIDVSAVTNGYAKLQAIRQSGSAFGNRAAPSAIWCSIPQRAMWELATPRRPTSWSWAAPAARPIATAPLGSTARTGTPRRISAWSTRKLSWQKFLLCQFRSGNTRARPGAPGTSAPWRRIFMPRSA